jgi:hypothetical protein
MAVSEPETVKIRFIKFTNGYDKGRVIDCGKGVADAYVNWRKAAEYVVEEKVGFGRKMADARKAARERREQQRLG